MSTYSNLKEEILMALYQEQADEGTNEIVGFQNLANEYEIEWKTGWLIEAQKELLADGLIRGPSNGSNDEMAFGRLSGRGLQYIEEKYGSRDGAGVLMVKRGLEDLLVATETPDSPPENAILTESGDFLVTEDGDYLVTEGDAEDAATGRPITVDSASWTGLTQRTIINARNAKVVSQLIGQALTALPESGAGNFENMQAAAFLKAAQELVDAPEPPSELIWQLISKAADLVGLIGLFYTIFVQAAS